MREHPLARLKIELAVASALALFRCVTSPQPTTIIGNRYVREKRASVRAIARAVVTLVLLAALQAGAIDQRFCFALIRVISSPPLVAVFGTFRSRQLRAPSAHKKTASRRLVFVHRFGLLGGGLGRGGGRDGPALGASGRITLRLPGKTANTVAGWPPPPWLSTMLR